jgi:hypothetical protein
MYTDAHLDNDQAPSVKIGQLFLRDPEIIFMAQDLDRGPSLAHTPPKIELDIFYLHQLVQNLARTDPYYQLLLVYYSGSASCATPIYARRQVRQPLQT